MLVKIYKKFAGYLQDALLRRRIIKKDKERDSFMNTGPSQKSLLRTGGQELQAAVSGREG
jgi:hypothetical protein